MGEGGCLTLFFAFFTGRPLFQILYFSPTMKDVFLHSSHVYEGLIHVNSTLVRLCHTNRASGKDSSDIRLWLSLFSGLINFFPLWYNNTKLQGGFVILLKIQNKRKELECIFKPYILFITPYLHLEKVNCHLLELRKIQIGTFLVFIFSEVCMCCDSVRWRKAGDIEHKAKIKERQQKRYILC